MLGDGHLNPPLSRAAISLKLIVASSPPVTVSKALSSSFCRTSLDSFNSSSQGKYFYPATGCSVRPCSLISAVLCKLLLFHEFGGLFHCFLPVHFHGYNPLLSESFSLLCPCIHATWKNVTDIFEKTNFDNWSLHKTLTGHTQSDIAPDCSALCTDADFCCCLCCFLF